MVFQYLSPNLSSLILFYFENPSHNPVPLIAVVSCLKERYGKKWEEDEKVRDRKKVDGWDMVDMNYNHDPLKVILSFY